MTATTPAPPYALAATPFPFPALAALTARLAVGGGREIGVACFLLARLCSALVRGQELPPELLRERADAARAWLTSQSIDHATRTALSRAIAATGSGDSAAAAAELDVVRTSFRTVLDGAGAKELERLAERLRS